MSISTSAQIELNSTTLEKKTNTNLLLVPFKGFLSFVRKSPRLAIFTILGFLVAVGGYLIVSNLNTAQPSPVLTLNQNFSVVALTQDGKKTNGKLYYQVTGAQKATSMLVQGQNVIVKNHKIFLIVNMEITNNYLVPLYTYPVDSFRLVDTDGKRYAPTTHQGNVEIRPESTKTSNVGFVVPETAKTFKIEAGDLTGAKTTLEFSL